MGAKSSRTTFGQQLRAARERSGLTQRELAEQAEIADKYVSRLELGIATPSIAVTRRLAEALETSIDDLIGTRPAAQDAELGAVLRLLRGRSSAEIGRARRILEELFRGSGR